MMKGLSILGLGLLIIGCSPTLSKDPDAGPKTVSVDRQDLVGYSFFDGKVLVPPGAVATAYSPYDLPISEVSVSVGKKVGRGQTLLKLSMPDVQAALSQAKLNLKSAQAAFETAKAQYDGPVREAQRLLAEARSQEKAARLALQNGEMADLEAATLARQSSEESLRLAIADRDGKLLAEREAVAAASEYLKEVNSGAKLSQVRAPISGTVIMLDAKPGEVAKTKKPLATVANLPALRIQGVLPPEHSNLVKKGSEILISVEGTEGDPIKGTVQEISVSPPRDGQTSSGYAILIDFPNQEGIVRPDSVIKRLGIETGKVSNALTVPVGAVKKGNDGKLTVKVQNGTSWTETPVVTGISDGAVIEIKSGLKEGDIVLVETS